MDSPNTKVFTKKLSKTDAKKRLAVPTENMASLPSFNGSHAIKIGLIYGTKTWLIHYTIRKNDSNRRPSFTSGWSSFASSNGLKPGDELSLYKAGSSLYRVQVEKPVYASPSNQLVPLPSPVLSLNPGVGETNSGNGSQKLPPAAVASPITELAQGVTGTLNTTSLTRTVPANSNNKAVTGGKIHMPWMIEEKWIGKLPSGQNSKADQFLRNPKETTKARSVMKFGAEISEQLGDKGKQPYMDKEEREINLSGLAAEGVAMAAHGGTSQLEADGEACGKLSLRIFGAETSEQVPDKGNQPYMDNEEREINLSGLAAEGVAMAAHGGTSQLEAVGEACGKLSLRIFGAETSEQVPDKGKQPYMDKEEREINLSGLAAEGVAMAAHGGTSQLEADGEACGKLSLGIFGAETREQVPNKGKQPYMDKEERLDAAGEACGKVTADYPRVSLDLVLGQPAHSEEYD